MVAVVLGEIMGEETEDWQVWLDEYTSNMGNITISGNDDYINYDDWITLTESNTHDNISLTGGGEEMLRIDKDGFYVRGVRVEADAQEAEHVYKAFKQWLTWANLSRRDEE
jgi:hypothetical protein